MTTQVENGFSARYESEKDFGAIIRRMESSRRAVHTGHWEHTRNRSEIKLRFENLRADYDSLEPMDVTAELDDDRDPRRIEFQNFRAGLYGRSPELRFLKTSSAINNNRHNNNNDIAIGVGAVALGAIVYEEDRKAHSRGDDFGTQVVVCGDVGTYYTNYYFSGDNRNGLRYTLNLRAGNRCDLFLDPIGSWDCGDRAIINECGDVIGWFDHRSRVTCSGSYRREGGRVIIEIGQFDNGYRRSSRSVQLCASISNNTLLFSDYDRGFWGSRSNFCFATRPSYSVYRPSALIYRNDRNDHNGFGYGDYSNRNDRNDRNNRDGRYDQTYNRNDRNSRDNNSRDNNSRDNNSRDNRDNQDSRRETATRETSGRNSTNNSPSVHNNAPVDRGGRTDSRRPSDSSSRRPSDPSSSRGRQAEPPSRSREREGR